MSESSIKVFNDHVSFVNDHIKAEGPALLDASDRADLLAGYIPHGGNIIKIKERANIDLRK